MTGSVQEGTFVAKNDSLITLCPSKFTDRAGRHLHLTRARRRP